MRADSFYCVDLLRELYLGQELLSQVDIYLSEHCPTRVHASDWYCIIYCDVLCGYRAGGGASHNHSRLIAYVGLGLVDLN